MTDKPTTITTENPNPSNRAQWEAAHRREVCAQALENLADYIRKGLKPPSIETGEIAGVWAVVITSGRASMRTRWVVSRAEDDQLSRLAWVELQSEFFSGLSEADAMLGEREAEDEAQRIATSIDPEDEAKRIAAEKAAEA